MLLHNAMATDVKKATSWVIQTVTLLICLLPSQPPTETIAAQYLPLGDSIFVQPC